MVLHVQYVTPEQLGIMYTRPSPPQANIGSMFIQAIPKYETFLAAGKLYKAYKEQKNKPKLDKSMIPKNSQLYGVMVEADKEKHEQKER